MTSYPVRWRALVLPSLPLTAVSRTLSLITLPCSLSHSTSPSMSARCRERFCQTIQRSRQAVYAFVTAYSVPPSCTMLLMYWLLSPCPVTRCSAALTGSGRVRRIFLHCLAVSCAPSGLRHPLKYNLLFIYHGLFLYLPRFLLLRTWSSSTE